MILWNQQGKFGDDRGDRSDHDRPNRTMFYPGDNDRRGRLDRPQIFPHCFHKIAQIACELFLAKGLTGQSRIIMENRLGAVKVQFFVRRVLHTALQKAG